MRGSGGGGRRGRDARVWMLSSNSFRCGGDYLSPLVCVTPWGAFRFLSLFAEIFRELDPGGGELGHGLGALGDGVLGELTGEDGTAVWISREVTVGFLL